MTSDEIYAMFKAGTRVVVARSDSYKKYNLKGQFGTVVRNQYSQYGKVVVDLDTEMNPRASMGYFYFKPRELSIINESNDDTLEDNNTMQNVINYFNIARIQYLDNHTHSVHYYANFDTSLKEGDLCVVKSLHHGLGLAKVVEILHQNDIPTPREIVAKVDTEAYDNREKSRKMAAELKAKMQERAKQLQDIALYQMLAKEDSEMQELLNSYQNLPLF